MCYCQKFTLWEKPKQLFTWADFNFGIFKPNRQEGPGRGQVPGGALFSMLAAAMNQSFSYPEDYISNPNSNLIGNKTLLLHLIWTVTSPNFVSRQSGSSGRQSWSGTCRGRTWRRPRWTCSPRGSCCSGRGSWRRSIRRCAASSSSAAPCGTTSCRRRPAWGSCTFIQYYDQRSMLTDINVKIV